VSETVETAGRVRAALNFAADRSDDGVWSNYTPQIRTQKLAAIPVDFSDARSLAEPASLEREGFELHRLPLGPFRWHEQAWIDEVYVPRSVELIRQVTGAPFVTPFLDGMTMIRDSGNPEFPPAADFVHFDQSRLSVGQFVERAAAHAPRRYPHVRLFNLWRVMTPPPQDVPLALCDQRSVDERDWVFGKTVEPGMAEGSPYTTSVFNPGQKWHYFSELTSDEVIVFKQYDSRPGAPMGCLHGAFAWPGELPGAVPRASMELRIFAFDEE
jgi:hypothetical protein